MRLSFMQRFALLMAIRWRCLVWCACELAAQRLQKDEVIAVFGGRAITGGEFAKHALALETTCETCTLELEAEVAATLAGDFDLVDLVVIGQTHDWRECGAMLGRRPSGVGPALIDPPQSVLGARL